MNPPLWGDENSHQPVKGLCIAPRARISLYVTCLEPPWALLPLEPRVRPLVGHFGLAMVWIELKIVARISNGYVLDSSVLHATISRVRAKHPPMGVKLRPCPYVYGFTKLCQKSRAVL